MSDKKLKEGRVDKGEADKHWAETKTITATPLESVELSKCRLFYL